MKGFELCQFPGQARYGYASRSARVPKTELDELGNSDDMPDHVGWIS